MNRRELLKAAATLPLAQIAFSNATFAQSPYPSRNITMTVSDAQAIVDRQHDETSAGEVLIRRVVVGVVVHAADP